MIGGAGMECAATGKAGRYLGQAQWAMRRCLEAEAAAAEAAAAGGLRWEQQATDFPLVVYEELQPAAAEKEEAVPPPTAATGDDYRRWPLVAALPGVGRARRSAQGHLAVALGEGNDAGAAAAEGDVVLVLNSDGTELQVLPAGQRYALPALREVGSGARMPKPLRARMRALQRVLRAVEDGRGGCGVGV